MPLFYVRDDITRIKAEAIVAPTDRFFSHGGGSDLLIYEAAGKQLDEALKDCGPLETGDVYMTSAFEMTNTDHIIFVSGPVYRDGKQGEEALLKKSYHSVLSLAKENGFASLALPLISSGSFGYPKKEALKAASDVISSFLRENEMDIYLLVYDKEAFDISKELYKDVRDYLMDHGIIPDERRRSNIFPRMMKNAAPLYAEPVLYDYAGKCESVDEEMSLSDIMDDYIEDESFNECLRRMIKEKKLNEVDVYKNANLTKQAFNGIYNEGKIPKKNNTLALAIGLKLDLSEAEEFIEKAGYSFGRSKQDYIVRYFIEKKIYDIYQINAFLIHEDLSYLGSRYE